MDDHSALYTSVPLEDPGTQIRLLHYMGREKDNQPSYKFEVHHLANAPDFEAISYTWGDANRRETILVDGVQISVTVNCYDALSQAQGSGSSCTWIDSVCIDQQNLTQKNAQVAIMWNIYNAASSVLACIGPSDDSSDFVCAALLNIQDALGRDVEDYFDEELLEDFDEESWALGKGSDYCKQLCHDYNQLCERSYFSRLWIVQELHAGGPRVRVMFGTRRVHWNLLEYLWRILDRAFAGITPHPPSLFGNTISPESTIQDLCALLSESPGIDWQHLEWISDLLCLDDRDRIYGTLCFINWERTGVPPLQPDYTKSAFELAVLIGSLSKKLDMYQFSVVLHAMKVTAHDPLLVPLLSSSDLNPSSRQSEIRTWEVLMGYHCRLNKIRRGFGKRLLPISSFKGPDVGTSPCSIEFRKQCEHMLRTEAVAEGYGWHKFRNNVYDRFMIPSTAEVGDEVLSFVSGELDFALVVRMDSDSQRIAIVGQARRRGALNSLEQHCAHGTPPAWRHTRVKIEATVEEIISLLVPTFGHDEDFGIEPLAFRLPKVVSITKCGSKFEEVSKHPIVELEHLPKPSCTAPEDVPFIDMDDWSESS